MGAWVRDSTAGVGTLSYYDPESKTYGALGHAINDGDTGKLLPVRLGSLMRAEIVDVRRGQKGTPGELRGSFLRNQQMLGTIEQNTELGIYGVMKSDIVNPLYPDGVPVGYQESVKPGPATILSTIDGNGIRAYSVEIVQAARQSSPSPKSMILRVTDQELLEKTGGTGHVGQPHSAERAHYRRGDPRLCGRPHPGLRHLHRMDAGHRGSAGQRRIKS